MSETTPKAGAPVASPVDNAGAHDRVAMLSVKADGTPDQTSAELIGDKDAALAATKEQFTQQAVSAVDQKLRGTSSADPVPSEDELATAHQDAAKAAEAAATSVVDQLHQA